MPSRGNSVIINLSAKVRGNRTRLELQVRHSAIKTLDLFSKYLALNSLMWRAGVVAESKSRNFQEPPSVVDISPDCTRSLLREYVVFLCRSSSIIGLSRFELVAAMYSCSSCSSSSLSFFFSCRRDRGTSAFCELLAPRQNDRASWLMNCDVASAN